MKKKILILAHGGTIVMTTENGVLVPATQDSILQIVPSLGEVADITFVALENIDSTNVNPTHWTKLILEIQKAHSEFDAIIITHGTDTMAYTAGAVSIACGRGLKIPIVFTGSQKSLREFGSDARFNLENAMKVALRAIELRIAEVMIVFSDHVLRGCRAIKTSESRFDAFDSPAFPWLARIDAGNTVNFIPETFKVDENIPFDVNPHFQRNILSVELVPGFEPAILRAVMYSGNCKGLLLKSLGAGNVPDIGEYSIIPVIKEAVEKCKIPVLVSTKFVGGKTIMNMYGPGKAAFDAGAIPTGDMTDVMSQVKFMWALVNGFNTRDALLNILNKNLVGEVTE